MAKVIFKNLKSSDLAKSIVLTKIEEAVTKFPELARHKIFSFFAMDNSPAQAGLVSFSFKLSIDGKLFKKIIIEKHGMTLYEAVSEVAHILTERLQRASGKMRAIRLAHARRYQYKHSWEHWYESAA
mgnify:CR=1 FL=1